MKKLINLKIYIFLIFILSVQISYGQPIASAPLIEPISGMEASLAAIPPPTVGAIGETSMADKMKSMCSTHPYACAIAVVAGVQAVSYVFTASDASKSAKSMICDQGYCGGSAGSPLGVNSPADNTKNPYANTIKNIDKLDKIISDLNNKNKSTLAELAKKGYVWDPSSNKVKTPKGDVDPSSFSSADAMKNAGMSPDQIAEVQAAMKDAEKLAKSKFAELAKSMSQGMTDAGGSMVVRNKKFEEGDGGFDMNKYLAGLGRGPASAEPFAGLSKNVGNDSIGVSGDNIFKMINRQYQNQQTKIQFIK